MGRAIVTFILSLIAVGVLVGIGAEIYQAGVTQGVIDAGRFPAGANVPVVGYGGGHGFNFLGLLFPLLFLFLIFGLIRAAFSRGRGWGHGYGRGYGWGPGWDKGDGRRRSSRRGARSATGAWPRCTAGCTNPRAAPIRPPAARRDPAVQRRADGAPTGRQSAHPAAAALDRGSLAAFASPAGRVTPDADRARRR